MAHLAQLEHATALTLLALAVTATRLPSILGLRLSLRLQRLPALLQQIQLLHMTSGHFRERAQLSTHYAEPCTYRHPHKDGPQATFSRPLFELPCHQLEPNAESIMAMATACL